MGLLIFSVLLIRYVGLKTRPQVSKEGNQYPTEFAVAWLTVAVVAVTVVAQFLYDLREAEVNKLQPCTNQLTSSYHTRMKLEMRGKAQRDGRPLGGSELRSHFSPFVDQSRP